MWHKADWDKVAQDPESISMPREDWIHGHNAEVHAESVVAETVKKFSSDPSAIPAPNGVEPEPIKIEEHTRKAVPVS